MTNQTTPIKRKTTPTSIMATYEEMSFVFSETFASYAQARNKKRCTKRTNVVQLVHRDSRTLEAARKRVPKRVEKANEVSFPLN